MLFSVAYYGNGATNLEQAQTHKMDLSAKQMKLKPGMRILDLGCGFGGLRKYLSSKYHVSVVGVTNSREMAVAARDNCYGLNVEIRDMDWRDLDETEQFDRVVGIEVMFHCGRHNMDTLFKKIHQCLKPEGICVIQDFSCKPGCPNNFVTLQTYWFPGFYIFHKYQVLSVAERYFRTDCVLDMTDDIVKTCADILKNLEKSKNSGDWMFEENLYTIYKLFFLCAEPVVKSGMFNAYQITLKKSDKSCPTVDQYNLNDTFLRRNGCNDSEASPYLLEYLNLGLKLRISVQLSETMDCVINSYIRGFIY